MRMSFFTATLLLLFVLTTSCTAQSSSQTVANKAEAQAPSQSETSDKLKVADVVAVFVKLDIADKQALFVLLAKDGSINRLGTGTEDNTENDLFVGITKSGIFETLRNQIEADVFNWQGEYKSPKVVGKTCKLTVGFRFANGRETGSVWEYGAQSQGPPPEIKRLVVAAVNATEIWFEEQKRVAKKKI